jgi:hypothetical protein
LDDDGNFGRRYKFSNSLAAVKYNNKWGYIDKKGQFVINPNYKEGYNFNQGLAVVGITKYLENVNDEEDPDNIIYKIIDQNGKFINKQVYRWVYINDNFILTVE